MRSQERNLQRAPTKLNGLQQLREISLKETRNLLLSVVTSYLANCNFIKKSF